ncbi:hypothetical protein GGF42_008887, partial [Coemansia sp. RSA 2424]
LAAVSVVVTDKTGTLTRSRLVVSSLVAVSADPAAAACGLAVEVLTPEAAQLSERSAALATPLYAAWALSVDPLEARPLAQRVAAIQAQGLIQTQPQTWGQGHQAHQGHRGHQTHQGRRQGRPIEPVRGFGKDFLNSAVLNSLPSAAGDDDIDDIDAQKQLPRDPDTGSVPVLAITDAISALCNCLSEPTGELPFDAALRVSARTRTAAAPPASFARRRPNGNGDGSSANNVFAAAKHWTVIKGAPEALVPQCTRVWHAAASGDDVLPAPLLAEDIRAGRVAGIDAMPAALAQTIARSAATLAAGGSRVIAYALAITDEPLYAPVDAAPAAATTLDVEDAAHPLLPLPSDLVFVGAFAFFDPPQREARPVVQECQDAGIRVILATGDHPSTALSVASAVGIVESHNYHHHNSRAAERLPPPAPPPPLSYGALGSSNTGVVAAAEVHAVTGEMVQRSLALGS